MRRTQRRRHTCSLRISSRLFIVFLCYLLLLLTQTCMASSNIRRSLEEQEVERRGPHEEEEQEQSSNSRQSTLTDVWLCLACSLGWTVWMVAAHIRPQVEQYATEATVVYGNVLQTSVFIGEGIPMYRSVVDYVLADVEETLVRKEFTTDDHLEEGFANVEILVLPTDPTSGVLKRDWEREYTELLHTHETRKRGRTLSLVLGALLVTVSLAGAIISVMRLPLELTTWGWVSIVAGVALLWPVAILLWINGSVITNFATTSKEEKGVVIRGEQPPPFKFRLNPCASMDETFDEITSVATPKRKTMEPRTTKPPAIEMSRIATKAGVMIPPSLKERIKISDESTVEPRAGCYFIKLPFTKRTASCNSRGNTSNSSSVSSMSSASITPNEVVHPPSEKTTTSNARHYV